MTVKSEAFTEIRMPSPDDDVVRARGNDPSDVETTGFEARLKAERLTSF